MNATRHGHCLESAVNKTGTPNKFCNSFGVPCDTPFIVPFPLMRILEQIVLAGSKRLWLTGSGKT